LLFQDNRPEEQTYELGKVANLRVAARHLNGVRIGADEVFSFWRQLGPPFASRGFVTGRMLQSGCVVPAVGGGLCQLSNALYELALRTGSHIVERHPHSHRLPSTPENDATVAWNYIDLRFRPRRTTRIVIELTASELIVAMECERHTAKILFPLIQSEPVAHGTGNRRAVLETCATCGMADCSRHESVPPQIAGRQAFLADAFTPEFDHYIHQTKQAEDCFFIPIDGHRWRQSAYAWSTQNFSSVQTQVVSALLRSWRMRRVATQGAARQRELLRSSACMAKAMLRALPHSVSHLVIDQPLLPAIAASGELGGRTYDVLMRRLPMRILQNRLDAVARRWPQSRTAADFRVHAYQLEEEERILAGPSRIITPHTEIAALFPDRTILLDWSLPARPNLIRQIDGERPRIFFPGPVTARKGAFELREALDGLGTDLLWRGGELEGLKFWGPLAQQRAALPPNSITAMVQPSYVEESPRWLLRALAAGIPVITTAASGLSRDTKAVFVPPGDVKQLRSAIQSAIAR
jgi:hypothetical protein